jgi:hypothetical protein
LQPLPITTQTAYAELLDQLVALEARRSIGHAPGTFVTKEIKGRTYYYFQYSTPGGTTRQAYVGPRSRELEATVRRFERERTALTADRAQIASLASVLRAGGAVVTDAASARVLGALAEAGIFRLGGLLVGTQAFLVLGNMLGVRWTGASARTEDIDIAAERLLEVAIPELSADMPKALESLGMGFLPAPGLSPRTPSTSFKVRGRGLRVDLITPAQGAAHAPVHVTRFKAAAAPVKFLDFLFEDVQSAAVVNGGGVLVSVPHPARFAVHKLLVAQDRPVALQTKTDKDLIQAALLADALEELRPGDLRAAWTAARRHGKGWIRGLDRAVAILRKRLPDAAARIEAVVVR